MYRLRYSSADNVQKHIQKPPKEIYGIEIMPEAVELFDRSVAENNLSDRIKPVLCDLKDPQGVPREYFDIVTVNPPYWKKGSGEERLSDVQAAARHEILCNIDDVMKTSASLFKNMAEVLKYARYRFALPMSSALCVRTG